MPWMARVRVDELTYDLLVLMKKAAAHARPRRGVGQASGSSRPYTSSGVDRPWAGLCADLGWTRDWASARTPTTLIGNPHGDSGRDRQTIQLALELNSDSIQSTSTRPTPARRLDLYKAS